MSAVEGDINQVIASAVQARIESEVAAALAGSDLMNQYVAAALHQKITVRKGYRDEQTTYLREAIDGAIRAATKAAVAKVVAEEQPAIEKAVVEEMRRDIKGISKTLVGKLAEASAAPYGISVELRYANGGEV